MKKLPLLAKIVLIGIVLFGLIQFVPYGKNVTNPAVINEPKWDSAITEGIARASCYDCHSNETHYPWYSKVAPASWLFQRDVDKGRAYLNFSEWPTDATIQQVKISQIQEILSEGEMPPIQYTLVHPATKLSSGQVNQLIASLKASVAK